MIKYESLNPATYHARLSHPVIKLVGVHRPDLNIKNPEYVSKKDAQQAITLISNLLEDINTIQTDGQSN